MRPPPGFASQLYPLRHRVIYSFGLSANQATMNSAFATLVRHSTDVDLTPKQIEVNPHNIEYKEETGPAVQKMSIIDKMRLSIRFNMTSNCHPRAYTSGLSGAPGSEVFTGDGINHIKFLWRPIFFSFREKLDAADDDTGTTVSTLLGLTADDTFKDVVPLTTDKLSIIGASKLNQPLSTVNMAEVIGDYNMTTDATMEDHPWDETLFQNALKRFTNKGALKACVGRTRYVNLSTQRPYKSFYLDKFVPRSIRRVMPFTFMGIQVNVPRAIDIGQDYYAVNLTNAVAHIGCKIIANYHEWNSDHFQDMTGDATP